MDKINSQILQDFLLLNKKVILDEIEVHLKLSFKGLRKWNRDPLITQEYQSAFWTKIVEPGWNPKTIQNFKNFQNILNEIDDPDLHNGVNETVDTYIDEILTKMGLTPTGSITC